MALSKRSTFWLRAVIAAGSLVIALVLAELFLRVFPSQADLIRIYNMERIPETMLLAKYDSKIGFRMEPNVRLRYDNTELHFDIATDGQGYRLLVSEKTAEPSVVFVGDSFVWGTGVQASETVAAKFTEFAGLSSPVLPLAAPGWSSGQMMLALEDYLDSGYRPNLVAFFFHLDNDLHENVSANPMYPRFSFSEGARLSWEHSEDAPRSVTLLRQYGSRGHGDWYLFQSSVRWGIVDRFLSQSYLWIRLRNTILNRRYWLRKKRVEAELNFQLQVQGKIMERITADLARKNIGFAFSNIPSSEAMLQGKDKINDWFIRKCAEHSYPCIDFLDGLRKLSAAEPRSLYFPLDRHWTAAGHRCGAQLLYSFFRSRLTEVAEKEPMVNARKSP